MILITALYRLHQVLENPTPNICRQGRGHVIARMAQNRRQVIVVHVMVEFP